MTYQEAIPQFWENVIASIENGTFAKLTLAKPFRKPELKNIFIRPISLTNEVLLSVKFYHRTDERLDKELELNLEETLEVLNKHIFTPFSLALLFTIEQDITLKVNKKGIATIIENPPTFRKVTLVNDELE